jgi:hypothetical protein
MLALAAAILLELEPTRASGLLLDPIVPVATGAAFKPDIFSHEPVPSGRSGFPA